MPSGENTGEEVVPFKNGGMETLRGFSVESSSNVLV